MTRRDVGARAASRETRVPLSRGSRRTPLLALAPARSLSPPAHLGPRYYIALDKALLKYHSVKVTQINRIVRELWQLTYMGEDIDQIEIVSGEEGASSQAKRSYNYRVVMRKARARARARQGGGEPSPLSLPPLSSESRNRWARARSRARSRALSL